MVEISPLAASERSEWEVLMRAFRAHYNATESDEDYERVWCRLLDAAEPVYGIGARSDGRLVGIAHYNFHQGIWRSDACYLADLYVDGEIRRQGIARAMLDWIGRDAVARGAGRFYWHTPQDADSRPFYDKVATFSGLVLYSRKLDVTPA
jgi:GNAT superfamily N-acetyltransferase